MSEEKHQCEKAKKHGVLYFYSKLWNSWAEKYTEGTAGYLGVITTAFYCKFCGINLGSVSQ